MMTGAVVTGSIYYLLDGIPQTQVRLTQPMELSFPLGEAKCVTEVKIVLPGGDISPIECTSAGCSCPDGATDTACSMDYWEFSSEIDGSAGTKPENLPECLYADTINIATSITYPVDFEDISFKGFSVAG